MNININTPKTADITTPLDFGQNQVVIKNLSFKNLNGYSLVIEDTAGNVFKTTARIKECDFYGLNGVEFINGIGSTIKECDFYTEAIGLHLDGCTNNTISDSKFQNQSNAAIILDGSGPRNGGENNRFEHVEIAFAVTGMRAINSRWITIENSLIDFTSLPLEFNGTRNFNVNQSYFGSSPNPIIGLLNQNGYQAPIVQGRVVDAKFNNPFVVSGVFSHCWFANYSPSGNLQSGPMLNFDGTGVNFGISNIKITFCDFISPGDHLIQDVIKLENVSEARIVGNNFDLPNNPSSTLSNLYNIIGTTPWRITATMNTSRNARNNGAIVLPDPAYEY